MTWKYFLFFYGLPFHWVDSVLWWAKVFHFDEVLLNFCGLSFWYHIQEFITKFNVMSFFFFLWWDWGLNLGLCTCKWGALLPHNSSPFFSGYFGDEGLMNYCRLALNYNLPRLSLPSSWNAGTVIKLLSCVFFWELYHFNFFVETWIYF
jgi:hypothetical protein